LIAIVFTEGPLAGERVELDGDVTVGRQDCDVTLDDREVSRRHVALRPAGDYLHVEDLGSSNGTRVNGSAIAEAVSAGNGDVIRLGTCEAVVQIGVPPPPPEPTGRPDTLASIPVIAEGGLPGGFWIATGLAEIALILTAATLLVYYAAR
jgi:pSer/pThr/pTyr-binding forkhead associated (FHA) protein